MMYGRDEEDNDNSFSNLVGIFIVMIVLLFVIGIYIQK